MWSRYVSLVTRCSFLPVRVEVEKDHGVLVGIALRAHLHQTETLVSKYLGLTVQTPYL